MWDEDRITDYLKKNLKEKRFIHSINVSVEAQKLAKQYNADIDKARIAGLVHDCAKNMSDEVILNIIKKTGYNLEYGEKMNPNLLHGKAGAIMSRDIFEICDDKILSAVEYHTTGKANMTLLEKIIYLADYIEPQRSFDAVYSLRDAAYLNLNMAVLLALDNSIRFVIEQKGFLLTETVNARNFLIENIVSR